MDVVRRKTIGGPATLVVEFGRLPVVALWLVVEPY
jgi:hypothetical protein